MTFYVLILWRFLGKSINYHNQRVPTLPLTSFWIQTWKLFKIEMKKRHPKMVQNRLWSLKQALKSRARPDVFLIHQPHHPVRLTPLSTCQLPNHNHLLEFLINSLTFISAHMAVYPLMHIMPTQTQCIYWCAQSQLKRNLFNWPIRWPQSLLIISKIQFFILYHVWM